MDHNLYSFKVCFVIMVIYFLAACDKSEPVDNNHFSVQSQNTGIRGWVLLHTLDGSQCLQAIQITTDSKLNFGSVDTNRVTVTIIRKTGDELSFPINIQTYVDVIAGGWKIKGSGYRDRGSAYFAVYSGINGVQVDSLYKWYCLPGYVSASSLTQILRLDDDSKLSVFAKAETHSGDSAYFGWLLNQNFEPDTNYEDHPYDIRLTVPMQKINISTSRPINYLAISGYRGSLYHRYSIHFRSFGEASTQHSVFHCPTAPVKFFEFLGSYESYAGGNDRFDYAFRQHFFSSMPSNFVISDASVTATYNEQTQCYENIDVSGTADIITGTWNYYRGDYHQDYITSLVQWKVSVNQGIQAIKRPFIPDSVWNDLGVLPTDSSDHSNIMIEDWDSCSDIDNYIQKNYIDDPRFVTQYSSYYAYRSSMSNGPFWKHPWMVRDNLE